MKNNSLANANSRNESAKRKRRAVAAVQCVLAVIVLLIVVFPIYWMLVSSVKSQEEILLAVPTLWPREFHFENYLNVLGKGNFAKYYWNTAVMTAGCGRLCAQGLLPRGGKGPAGVHPAGPPGGLPCGGPVRRAVRRLLPPGGFL